MPGRVRQDTRADPKEISGLSSGTSLRHWAIVNEGYWYRLKPAIEEASQRLDSSLRDINLEELDLTVSESTQVFAIGKAPSITGDAFRWPLEAKLGSASTAYADDEP